MNDTVDNVIDIAGGFDGMTVGAVDLIRQGIGRYFVGNDMRAACKLVVFNEMFFSQLGPLDTDQKNFIEGKLFDLSRSSLNTIFYPNFLYTEDRDVSGSTVHGDLVRMGMSAGRDGLAAITNVFPAAGGVVAFNTPSMFFHNAKRSLKGCALEVSRNRIPDDGSIVKWKYLVNETHAISGGSVLTRYKKVGYFKESDGTIEKGALYDSGSGHDEAVLVGAHALRDKLLRNISVDICLDLPIGVRKAKANHWANPGDVPLGDSRLHLVQSNSVDPFYRPANRRNLPTTDRGILHVDAYPHPSWDAPDAVERP